MDDRTTTEPAPIAIFCQVFIVSPIHTPNVKTQNWANWYSVAAKLGSTRNKPWEHTSTYGRHNPKVPRVRIGRKRHTCGGLIGTPIITCRAKPGSDRAEPHYANCCMGMPGYAGFTKNSYSRHDHPSRDGFQSRSHISVASPGESLMEQSLIQLSPLEQQITELLLQGCDNPEIARELKMNRRTVKAHFSRLFVRFGIQRGIKRVKLATLLYR